MNDFKTKEKIDVMQKNRAGKTKTLNVTISNKADMNFSHCMSEILKLFEIHKLVPDEAYAMSSQLQWTAINAKTRIMVTNTMNNILAPSMPTYEQKKDLKINKEKDKGIVRIKPGEEC